MKFLHFLLLAGLLALAVSYKGKGSASSMDERYIEALRRHYENSWGPPALVTRWPRGPVYLPDRRNWVYASIGMSLGVESGLELHLRSPRESEELVELLTVVAHYHRTGAKLGLHNAVNFGRPWLQGSVCNHGLITLPYAEGPKLERLTFAATRVATSGSCPSLKLRRNIRSDAESRRSSICWEGAPQSSSLRVARA